MNMTKQQNEKAVSQLIDCPLFIGVDRGTMRRLMPLMEPELLTLQPGAILVNSNDVVERIGLVIAGCLIERSADGGGTTRNLRPHVSGAIIGAEVHFSIKRRSLLEIYAEEKSTVLLFEIEKLFNEQRLKELIQKNIITYMAETAMHTVSRMEILLGTTLRERIMKYFHGICRKNNCDMFQIDMNQTELARYLSVNRSALCRELGKMQQDGIIEAFPNRRYHVLNWNTMNIKVRKKQTDKIKEKNKSSLG